MDLEGVRQSCFNLSCICPAVMRCEHMLSSDSYFIPFCTVWQQSIHLCHLRLWLPRPAAVDGLQGRDYQPIYFTELDSALREVSWRQAERSGQRKWFSKLQGFVSTFRGPDTPAMGVDLLFHWRDSEFLNDRWLFVGKDAGQKALDLPWSPHVHVRIWITNQTGGRRHAEPPSLNHARDF